MQRVRPDSRRCWLESQRLPMKVAIVRVLHRPLSLRESGVFVHQVAQSRICPHCRVFFKRLTIRHSVCRYSIPRPRHQLSNASSADYPSGRFNVLAEAVGESVGEPCDGTGSRALHFRKFHEGGTHAVDTVPLFQGYGQRPRSATNRVAIGHPAAEDGPSSAAGSAPVSAL